MARDQSTVDLIEGDFALLTGPAFAQTVSMRTIPIAADDAWLARAGIEGDGALLVRPDGVIAWRARHAAADTAGALRYALAQLSVR